MNKERNDKRSAILEAALDLFAENGFHGSPTALIARRAEVGVGTIYRYFKDKDELVRELFAELHDRANVRVYADFQEEEPVKERFIRLFSQILRFFLESPREFRFLEQYYYSPYSAADPLCNEGPEGKETAKRLLALARDQQILKDAPLPVLEAIAFGPLIALAKEHTSRKLVVDEAMIRLTVEACWDGLKR